MQSMIDDSRTNQKEGGLQQTRLDGFVHSRPREGRVLGRIDHDGGREALFCSCGGVADQRAHAIDTEAGTAVHLEEDGPEIWLHQQQVEAKYLPEGGAGQ